MADVRPRTVVTHSVEAVAEVLGNTPAVSRQSYNAPVVVEAFLAGLLSASRPRRGNSRQPANRAIGRREELAFVRFLEQRMSLDDRR